MVKIDAELPKLSQK